MRIAVFAKAPVAGSVKTRLVPLLGDEKAAAFHAQLVHRTLAMAIESGVGGVDLWCAPDASHPFFADCAARFGVRLRAQSDGDLGARMNDAFEAVHAEGEPLLLIGCDCLLLEGSTLRDAAVALASNDAVVAPAEDGGYVLVGLAAPAPEIFAGIEWSTSSVMSATRKRLASAGMRWKELAIHWDVDLPGDYMRAQQMGLLDTVDA